MIVTGNFEKSLQKKTFIQVYEGFWSIVDMFRSKRTVKYQDITWSNADGSYSVYIECSLVCFLHVEKVNSILNNVLIPL